MDNNYNDEPFDKSSPHIKSIHSVLISNYMNLLFCLTLVENWTEVIFYCNEYEKSEFFRKDKEIIYRIDNYKIEALINLREFEKAKEVIKNNFILLNSTIQKDIFIIKVIALLIATCLLS